MNWSKKFLMEERFKLLVSLAYLLLLLLLRRELDLTLIAGGLFGFLFLPSVKLFLEPQSERPILESVVFQAPLSALTLYAASSLQGGFGRGFILTLFLQTLLKYNPKWFWPVKGGVTVLASRLYILLMIGIFLYSSALLR